MDDRAICLPWDKNLVLTPLGQTIVYGKFTGIYKRIRRYPSVPIPPWTDTEKSFIGGTLIKWNSPLFKKICFQTPAQVVLQGEGMLVGEPGPGK